MFTITISSLFTILKSCIIMFGYIQSSQLFPEPLSSEEEKIILEKFNCGDDDARNILIERNLRLVAHISKKYSNTNIDQDDLISIGTIGLIKGVNSYDVNKNIRLATYVARCIENEILMYLRGAKKIKSEVYLNEPIGKDKDDNEITLLEILENDEKSIEDSIDLKLKTKKLYSKINGKLKEREKDILIMRYGLDGQKPRTQNEIAKILGISRSYVSRIETKAIKKLNKEFENELSLQSNL